MVDEDPLLASFDKQNKIQITSLYKRVADAVATLQPSLLILDTLANLHSGNENDKAHAMQFINKMKVLATKYRCAVVLLAHPSLSGMANGSGSAGSVGWTNNVRSRLYLSRIQNAEGVEMNTNERVLSTTKANYGAKDSKIEMLWQAGRFVAFGDDLDDMDDLGAVAETRAERADRVFLTLLDRFTREGSFVSRNTGHTYAPKIFAEQPDCERCSRDDFKAAMHRLFLRKAIENGQHNTKGKAISHIQRVPTRPDTRATRPDRPSIYYVYKPAAFGTAGRLLHRWRGGSKPQTRRRSPAFTCSPAFAGVLMGRVASAGSRNRMPSRFTEKFQKVEPCLKWI